MRFTINSNNGFIGFGPLQFVWGNALASEELPGYTSVIFGSYAIEFGDIDQGRSGIYLTRFDDGEPTHLRTLWIAA